MSDDTPVALGTQRVDEAKLIRHVDGAVRSSVEAMLHGLLNAEQICRAQQKAAAPRFETAIIERR